MIQFILLYVFSAMIIAITATTYSTILVLPGEIFGGLYGKLDILFKTDKRNEQGKGIHPIFKMIMQCEKCVAGQWALWSYLIYMFPIYKEGVWILVLPHLGFIGLSIFLTLITKKLYNTYIK